LSIPQEGSAMLSKQLRRRERHCVSHVNQAALARSRELIATIMPSSVTHGTQTVVPSRDGRRLTSIFPASGKWAVFDVVAHGDDLVGLVAHAFDMTPGDAAGFITAVLGIEWQTAPDVGDTTEAA
jgi:hypothetical protein